MELRCPDPTATVRAENVRATLEAFRLIPSAGKRLVEKHRLKVDDLRPGNTILVQQWLDALGEIQARVGPDVLRSVGTSVVERALFPDRFETVESVLLALDEIYYLNHRGNVGHYRCRRLDGDAVEVVCATPYPRHFERGLVEGIARNRRLTGGNRYYVQYIEGDGVASTCTLIARKLALVERASGSAAR
jgi:hypothetical protein